MKHIIKKTISLLLVLIMIFGLCSCNNETASDDQPVEILSKDQVPDAKDLVPESFIDPKTGWAKFDDLYNQIVLSTDTKTRAELLHEAEELVLSTYCIIPLFKPGTYYLAKDYLEGVYLDNVATINVTRAKLNNGSDTLKIFICSEPESLDPAIGTTWSEVILSNNIYAGLFRWNNDTQSYEPSLAKEMKVSEDGLTYTVILKDDALWSDGSPITAYDFAYAWNRAVDPMTAATFEYFFAGFDGYYEGKLNISVIDDKSFTFVLSAPCPYIHSLLSNQVFFPLKQSVVESYEGYESSPGRWCEESGFISSGAYIVKEWVHNSYMVLEKNPYYVFADDVSIKRIECLLSNDSITIFAAYNAGDLDLTNNVPNDELKGLKDNPEFHLLQSPGIEFISINAFADIFADKTPEEACCMRMAFALLFNRPYLCSNVIPSSAGPTSYYVPASMSDGNGEKFRDEDCEELFDVYGIRDNTKETLALARMYLQAAGFEFNSSDGKLSDSTPLKFEITQRGNDSTLEAIQQDLALLGIQTVLKVEESSIFYTKLQAGDFTLSKNGWYADYDDPSCMLSIFMADSPENYPHFTAK